MRIFKAKPKEKHAKVAQVVDDFRVIIDAGRNEGVDIGQHFLLYDIGDEVIVPQTRENLGRLELVKGTGRITQVQDKMATLETAEHKKGFVMRVNEIPEVSQGKRPFESPAVDDRVRLIGP
uniref:Uncharacterized protein n=1 Tax=Candidatus Kentrum sp. FM TaxID=2126340 RepID=A0A450S9V5_9GAMM|nr:MAG: hypothetical protein BECKFM1743A_GA0114220_1005114 [Candidatus Kentron sp. FM]VFJ48835.1 MAG: hypothetical protein BECKFM1743C_GA0114222_100642 [Candidatus Kentron sp. FM]VFK15419.1 MAG: hypothetical protein BECKFM1743B_GA0114221_103694 [Candidatus Kentron sp. FM]